jgi:hypothetical protein
MARLIYTAITSLDGYVADKGGNQALPDDLRLNLELMGERRFQSGVVHLHYRVRT